MMRLTGEYIRYNKMYAVKDLNSGFYLAGAGKDGVFTPELTHKHIFIQESAAQNRAKYQDGAYLGEGYRAKPVVIEINVEITEL